MNHNVHKRNTKVANDVESTNNSSSSSTTNPLKPRDAKVKKLRRIQRSKKRQSQQASKHQRIYLQLLLGGIVLFALMTMCVYRLLVTSPVKTSPHVLQALENEHAHTHGHHHQKDNDSSRQSERGFFKGWFGGGGGGDQGRGGDKYAGGAYKHDFYMDRVGDKTRYYASLRSEIDPKLPSGSPEDTERMQNYAKSIRPHEYLTMLPNDMDYDIEDCPETPPPNYPHAWNVKSVLENWPPDEVTPRTHIYQGICRFDASKDGDFQKAINYREAEVPFIYRNDPEVLRSVERWNQEGYLQRLIENDVQHRTEFSHNNHFMYWQKPRYGNKAKKALLKDWKAPTDMIRMTFGKWLSKANSTYATNVTPNQDHWYFRLIGCGEMGQCDQGSSEYLFDELSFFQPRDGNPLYMPHPKKQKGIHCRFGMKGVIAENHFDGSRNMIVILGGERRYILSHPDQCNQLELLPRGHPSARHSAVDWSQPDWDKFQKFKEAEVNEVVMQAGDVLYLPTHWFHYIISLGLNYQCNTRSGSSDEYKAFIEECGF